MEININVNKKENRVLVFRYDNHSFFLEDGNYIILDQNNKEVAGFSKYYFNVSIEKDNQANMIILVEYIPQGIEKHAKNHHRKGVWVYKKEL